MLAIGLPSSLRLRAFGLPCPEPRVDGELVPIHRVQA